MVNGDERNTVFGQKLFCHTRTFFEATESCKCSEELKRHRSPVIGSGWSVFVSVSEDFPTPRLQRIWVGLGIDARLMTLPIECGACHRWSSCLPDETTNQFLCTRAEISHSRNPAKGDHSFKREAIPFKSLKLAGEIRSTSLQEY